MNFNIFSIVYNKKKKDGSEDSMTIVWDDSRSQNTPRIKNDQMCDIQLQGFR